MPTTWPCDVLPSNPPPVQDALSAPTEASLLPQVLAVAPRGPAWGTDEAGDGQGASPVQLKLWRGIAGCIAEIYSWAFEVATQAFPTAITFSLVDWENELGLPDPCGAADQGLEARKAAVRAKVVAQGGASPGYFICVARAAGYDITIEEPSGFELGPGGSELGPGGGELTGSDPESVWIVRPDGYRMFEFEMGAGELGNGGTRLVSYTDIAGLECLLRGISPVHTQLVFVTS